MACLSQCQVIDQFVPLFEREIVILVPPEATFGTEAKWLNDYYYLRFSNHNFESKKVKARVYWVSSKIGLWGDGSMTTGMKHQGFQSLSTLNDYYFDS